jgi:hypothetical protein
VSIILEHRGHLRVAAYPLPLECRAGREVEGDFAVVTRTAIATAAALDAELAIPGMQA